MSGGLTYLQIKREYKGNLYEDPDFTATDDNIFYSKKAPHSFEWKRPKELRAEPKFIVGHASRFDVQQGHLGDGWLLSAIASATGYVGIFGKVVPYDQYFDSSDYCGVFRFNFWFQGEWVEVVVDDRLPTINNKLVFVHADNPDIFWSALFEKAYAKLHGSYEALKGGNTADAIVDITGRVVENMNLKTVSQPDVLFKQVGLNCSRFEVMGCSIKANPENTQTKLTNGLLTNCPYSVTGTAKVRVDNKEINLVRIRNPWGDEREWNRNFGDESLTWEKLSAYEKRKIGVTVADDGEFWMTFDDFLANFSILAIPVETGPYLTMHQGSWRKSVSAGGGRSYIDTLVASPQIRFELEEKQKVTIALMQKDRRKNKQRGKMNLTIGFVIYKIPDGDEKSEYGKLNADFFNTHTYAEKSHSYLDEREVTDTFDMEKGNYVIVPSRLEHDQNGHFLLQIFKEKDPLAERQYPKIFETPGVLMPIKDPTDFYQFFMKVAGNDEAIDAFDLQKFLTASFKAELSSNQFSYACCRTIIQKFDMNRTLMLEYTQFRQAWRDILQIKNAMKTYADENQSLDAPGLRHVLSKFGMKLNTSILSVAYGLYRSKEGLLLIDGVIDIVFTIRRLFDNFKAMQESGNTRPTETVQMTDMEFVAKAMYR